MKNLWMPVALAGGLLWAVSAWAQGTGVVSGSVVAASNGKPVVGVTCAVGAKSVKVNAKGEFRTAIAPGSYRVTCTAPGHRRAGKKVTVTPGSTVRVSLRLQSSKLDKRPEAEATEVKAEKISVRSKKDARRHRPRMTRGRKMKHIASGAAMAPPRPAPMAIAIGDAAPADVSREAYDKINENVFKSATSDPLSTFSIDVDTASYANMRRFINDGRMPPKDAVRIEELLNYFQYDYPDAKGEHPFAVHTEVSPAPWNDAHRLVHIGLQGKKVDVSALPPSNLVFLLDVSGSMNNANKLPLLKSAFRLLVNNLRGDDRVAIVVYAGAAGLVLPSTPGKERGRILEALNQLSAGGSTAGAKGIKLAYQVAQEHFIKGGNNRIILATDGDFNVGTSSDGELERLIEEKRKSGVFLTILGFGKGNYQDAKMEKLSNAGNGNAAYIDSILEAQKVLVTEMGGTLLTIAKDVKIQVEFNPAKVKAYRLIGYENRMLKAQDFNDDKKDAGELGAGHSVTALYEIIPAGSDEVVPGIDPLRYQKAELSDAAKNSPEMLTVKLRYKLPDGDTSTLMTQPLLDAVTPLEKTSADHRFSSAVAEMGLLLRDSKFKGSASFDALIARAKAAMGEDRHGYRFDFVGLAKKAALLKQTMAPPKTPMKMAK